MLSKLSPFLELIITYFFPNNEISPNLVAQRTTYLCAYTGNPSPETKKIT
jgi:hypothetical protein